ncbi:Tol-Pal system beta propeller repeat protein TolB [Sphingopyxis sp. GW247-27LB]|uniref:Tol-Pal system beta propeller repeat protein TolB n=1 Tax=Sphingopyxis sp. GW247-27LB TaxID=2012632 RepID=UPI000BA53D83|nr:Tol-Pal system beta propeller repeat protein TolB [Sphingopyxis sp. GW247-27LB]PAL21458.1 Tol-Pal system beta propeller repeat protein TolB [Sphingopyxis sp. GW247-27LB]
MTLRPLSLSLALLLTAAPVFAQETAAPAAPTPPAVTQTEPRETIEGQLSQDRTVIAVPALATPAVATVAGLRTDNLGRQIAEVIAADLERSGLYAPLGPASVRAITMPEVTAPRFADWKARNAENVVHGFVRTSGTGGLIVGCYLYDTALGSELVRQGFEIQPGDWRRAAHKCADAIYSRLSGESPFFDSRIAYIAESGPKGNRTKQLAIMDSDGGNHKFITNGQALALSPRFSPDYKKIVYVSYLADRVRVFIYNVDTGSQKLVTESRNATFAPRWSPDGRQILFSMAVGGNTDIYRISAEGGTPVRLTNTPGIDVGGSFSPDGRKIVFESDRSGSQQLYTMNIDGSGQQRISFGGGRYATPEWSPRGDLIAFTRMGGGEFRIGVMTPSGGGVRMLTNSWQDEAPTWAPNGRVIQFFRTTAGRDGKSSIWQVDLTGVNLRRLPTPRDGSDPSWGPIRP